MTKKFLKDYLKNIKTKEDLAIAFGCYKSNHKITDIVKEVFGDKYFELLNKNEKLEILLKSLQK